MPDQYQFDWDKQNEGHLARHGISRSDAEDVLLGNHVLLEYQVEDGEERWIAVGVTRIGSRFEYRICDPWRGGAPNYRVVS